jgi:hypothetical protein
MTPVKKGAIKQWLKRYPVLIRMKRAWVTLFLDLDARDRETIEGLPLFSPGSCGPPSALAKLTVLCANQTFPFLVHLLHEIGAGRRVSAMPAASFCMDEQAVSSSQRLKEVFDKHGSDKATEHDYHRIYGAILREGDWVRSVLEIGLGSNHEDVVSHMGRAGRPGASLRAFRDYLPNAMIYGADVDRRILFEEERIKTFFVDQTDLSSFDALGQRVDRNFDLIVDDGLHSPNANIAVLAFSLKRLKPGGWIVIEDIAERSLPVWEVIAALLPLDYEPHLISGKAGMVFAVQRNPAAAVTLDYSVS